MKVELKFASGESGAQYVMIDGTIAMRKWYVGNSDLEQEVCNISTYRAA